MKYLLENDSQNYDFCFVDMDCKCNSASCHERTCSQEICGLNKSEACPKHCWAQACVTAKVDPFNSII